MRDGARRTAVAGTAVAAAARAKKLISLYKRREDNANISAAHRRLHPAYCGGAQSARRCRRGAARRVSQRRRRGGGRRRRCRHGAPRGGATVSALASKCNVWIAGLDPAPCGVCSAAQPTSRATAEPPRAPAAPARPFARAMRACAVLYAGRRVGQRRRHGGTQALRATSSSPKLLVAVQNSAARCPKRIRRLLRRSAKRAAVSARPGARPVRHRGGVERFRLWAVGTTRRARCAPRPDPGVRPTSRAPAEPFSPGASRPCHTFCPRPASLRRTLWR